MNRVGLIATAARVSEATWMAFTYDVEASGGSTMSTSFDQAQTLSLLAQAQPDEIKALAENLTGVVWVRISNGRICPLAPDAGSAFMETVTIIGYLAAFCSMTSFTPQAWKIIKTRDTGSISAPKHAATFEKTRRHRPGWQGVHPHDTHPSTVSPSWPLHSSM